MKTHARTNSRFLFPVLTVVAVGCDRPTQPTSTASSAANASSAEPVALPTPAPSAPALAPPGSAGLAEPAASAEPARGATVGFDSETVGGPSSVFEAVVGDWSIAEEGNARGLKVDGGKWRSGTPSATSA